MATTICNNSNSNNYILLNRETSPDIENQINNDISQNNEIIDNESEIFTCVICYYDFSNTQLYSCVQCNECNLCFKCTLKIFNKDKCPVCQKSNPWCKKPNGKVVKNNRVKTTTPSQERNQITVIRNRNNYSKCYTILLFVF